MDLSPSLILTACIGVLIIVYTCINDQVRRRALPGPEGWPIVGNLFAIPRDRPWNTYLAWSQTYGPIVQVKVFGKPIVILNTAKAVSDLFESRSAIYSDRPKSLMVSLLGLEWSMILMGYSPVWRKSRRLVHMHFTEDAISNYEHIQLQNTRKLLSLLAQDPEGFVRHTRFAVGATLLELVYGSSINDPEHPYLKCSEGAAQAAIEASLPGNMTVEFLPFLRYMPSWFPGATFKRKLPQWRANVLALRNNAFEEVKAAWRQERARSSLTTRMLDDISGLSGEEHKEAEGIVRDVSAMIYVAGADTTFSVLQTFFLAMTLHPEIQKKAHEELDQVVGSRRLPGFTDRDYLPYVAAIVKECIRWVTVIPLGVARINSEDDVYEGYHIPKGTILMPNQWAILHDPAVFPEPNVFKPERFLKDGQLDPRTNDLVEAAFGFGRRLCPGKHFGQATLFINIASILHVFDVAPSTNASGEVVYPEIKLTSGLSTYPTDFQCAIRPRTQLAEQLIAS
ncbi:hypothetical protein CERSUDRAFT_157065 [Gelatoporia subvermispora B]|uniref:Cytochrome P450 n=1 Tax=Ceriporiopsis subvermispora (strain B) TaxID=914234 RepID=M2RA84_CERS8|nr:hypothetical protein CERSUDRAFT_157065 [Gelatoporia subvermispora B]